MLRWIRLTALVAAVETQASPVKPASGWSAIRAWPWSRRVGSSSDASGPAHLANLEAEQLRPLNGAFVGRDQTAVGRDVERVLIARRAPERARRGADGALLSHASSVWPFGWMGFITR